jgi:ribosomal protein S18 acetylase RimI-like enzyme
MVHPDYQNRRIGTRLMQAIENKFGDVHRFELYTGHKSAKNLSLYAKLGYREFARKRQSDNVMLINLEKAKHAGTPEVRDR